MADLRVLPSAELGGLLGGMCVKALGITPEQAESYGKAAIVGDIPGQEIWKQLAACALLVLLAEVAVGRWITMQRRSHSVEQIDFGAEAVDPRNLWDKLRWEPAAPEPARRGER